MVLKTQTVQTVFGTEELTETKKCSECGTVYPKTKQYFGVASGGQYLRGTCKVCDKKHSKITRELKKVHKVPKNHKCPICGITEKGMIEKGYRVKWCLDHDHKTGEFRGYLCDNCNTALSKFKDHTKILNEAINYLKSS